MVDASGAEAPAPLAPGEAGSPRDARAGSTITGDAGSALGSARATGDEGGATGAVGRLAASQMPAPTNATNANKEREYAFMLQP